jgi:hypothetical protein
MFNNSESLESYITDNPIYIVQLFCVMPEYFNLFFLTCGLYGMYQGIEISHPLYAVLFLNLIVATISTILDIVVFFFISTYKYVLYSNFVNALSLFFHCTCWCLTSVLRFVYIICGDWFNNFISSQKLQCTSAIIMTFILSALLTIPTLSVAISYGKQPYMRLIFKEHFFSS